MSEQEIRALCELADAFLALLGLVVVLRWAVDCVYRWWNREEIAEDQSRKYRMDADRRSREVDQRVALTDARSQLRKALREVDRLKDELQQVDWRGKPR